MKRSRPGETFAWVENLPHRAYEMNRDRFAAYEKARKKQEKKLEAALKKEKFERVPISTYDPDDIFSGTVTTPERSSTFYPRANQLYKEVQQSPKQAERPAVVLGDYWERPKGKFSSIV